MKASDIREEYLDLKNYAENTDLDMDAICDLYKKMYHLERALQRGRQDPAISFRDKLEYNASADLPSHIMSTSWEIFRNSLSEEELQEAYREYGALRATHDPYPMDPGTLPESFLTFLTWGIPFAGVFMIVRAQSKGLNPVLQLLNWRIYYMAFLWPYGVFRYPDGHIALEVRRVGKTVSTALLFSIFCFAGGPGGKKPKPERQGGGTSVEFDFRLHSTAAGAHEVPDNDAFLRTTVVTESGLLLENVATAEVGPRKLGTQFVTGRFFKPSESFRFAPVVGVRVLPKSKLDYIVGIQIFAKPLRRWSLALPVIQLEQGHSKTNFRFAGFATRMLGEHWRAGIEFSFKFEGDGIAGWKAAPLIARKMGKKLWLEFRAPFGSSGRLSFGGRMVLSYGGP